MIRLLTVIFTLSCIAAINWANTDFRKELPDPYGHIQVWEDTIPPIQDRTGSFTEDHSKNPFDLRDPQIVKKSVEYDPETGNYYISEKIGDDYFRTPTTMTFDEYLESSDYRIKKFPWQGAPGGFLIKR